MPDFNAIADVSETLKDFLERGLREESDLRLAEVQLADLQDFISPDPPKVTLFLFEALEDPSARNRPRVREPANGQVKIKKPDVALMLRYLVTPWGQDQLTVQKLLGRITQLFYDQAIISGSHLRGSSLSNSSDALKLRLAPLTLEERTRIWHSVTKPYRLSITYEVRVVNIEPKSAISAPRVSSREVEYGQIARQGRSNAN